MKPRAAKRVYAAKKSARKTFRGPKVIAVSLVILIGTGITLSIVNKANKTEPIAAIKHDAEQIPTSLNELLALNKEKREKCTIALMNLLCAQGLRGSENLNLDEAQKRLEEMAVQVKRETDRHFYKFSRNPNELKNSEAYFRMLALSGPRGVGYWGSWNGMVEGASK